MKTISIEVDEDSIDNIVRCQLKNTLSFLQKDIENRRNENSIALFSINIEEDIEKMKEMEKAFEMVLDFY